MPDTAADATAASPRTRSRSFGPTVLAGLAGAGSAAVAAARDWATAASGGAGATRVSAVAKGSESAPLAVALALVALAAWGTVLVLRGWARRAVAAVGALAAAGTAAAVVAAYSRATDDATTETVVRGATRDSVTASLTGWYYVCAVGAVVTLLAFCLAVRTASSWPAMGSRYDNPAVRGTGSEESSTRPVTEQDMWRALDDGQDPTA
jgi:uncharacterized membrane protein (TIGR02234 family)